MHQKYKCRIQMQLFQVQSTKITSHNRAIAKKDFRDLIHHKNCLKIHIVNDMESVRVVAGRHLSAFLCLDQFMLTNYRIIRFVCGTDSFFKII
ncbi:hypothetical protein PVAND_010409 [Polypedilum vanderplanki]|uniref:Uncharacterized protein n=1 Tax=Polypedilum vanderplanki TaxID=319348 RepID=A0A9J6CG55_POLVA|nr:hypothetical protein PVAND_010409 [Polypedilum vanderplanki]